MKKQGYLTFSAIRKSPVVTVDDRGHPQTELGMDIAIPRWQMDHRIFCDCPIQWRFMWRTNGI